MKWATYRANGIVSYGVVRGAGGDGTVIDDAGPSVLGQFPTLRSAIEANALQIVAAQTMPERFRLDEVELLPTIPDARKLICIGLNYREHALEAKLPVPDHPAFFARFANTVVGSGSPIWLPRISDSFDFEGELAVVIGSKARYLDPANALKSVAGYSCFGDHSIRDFQMHSTTGMAGKNFPATAALGPWLVTADEIADPQTLEIETRLNGVEVQRSSTSDMLFSVAEIVAYLSQVMELEPGDVIATGTPKGVGWGRMPYLWMKVGDNVTVSITSIGTLGNTVVREAMRGG